MYTQLPHERQQQSTPRVVGFYTNLETAQKAVEENWCDIFEYLYEYALIEEITEGIYRPNFNRWLYKLKYDEDLNSNHIFHQIEEPEEMKHIVNFSMG